MSDKQCPMASNSNGCVRKLFLKTKDAIKCRCSGRCASLVDREFHAVVTFVVALIAKLIYLRWLMVGGAVAEYNILSRYIVYLHVVVLLVGGAMLRCFIGYYLVGGHMQDGGTFDYPEEGNNADKPAEHSDKSNKSNKEKVSPPQDNEDETKISG